MYLRACSECEYIAKCKDTNRIVPSGYSGYERWILAICRHCPLDYNMKPFGKAAILEEMCYKLIGETGMIEAVDSKPPVNGWESMEHFMGELISRLEENGRSKKV